MTHKERILIFRFSAMGDVAMTAPVLKEFAEQNPNCELLIVSRENYKPFFQFVPNAVFIGVDLNNYKGFFGLKKLAAQLALHKPTMIADLHNVVRTKLLKLFLLFSVKKIATLNKARKERKALTRKKNKISKPLRHMSERYADVFRDLGFSLTLSYQLKSISDKTKNAIGIAPFANYTEKIYPLENTKSITLELAQNGYEVYLFGGGKKEISILSEWETFHQNIHSLAGKLSLEEEIKFISTLPLMVSMDSANMHIASLTGTKVVSIWGATHPFAGFLGYGQNEENIIQNNHIECRPCSIFGNKKCFRGDHICMYNLSEQEIINKITSIK